MSLSDRCPRLGDLVFNALLDLRHAPLHLGASRLFTALNPAAVNRDAGLREQAHRAAQCDNTSTNLRMAAPLIPPE
jgi:hypothetical protein